jgi:hypothetical protein
MDTLELLPLSIETSVPMVESSLLFASIQWEVAEKREMEDSLGGRFAVVEENSLWVGRLTLDIYIYTG